MIKASLSFGNFNIMNRQIPNIISDDQNVEQQNENMNSF